MIDDSDGDLAHRRRLVAHLDAMLALCETAGCRRRQMLAYFGETGTDACGNCDTCLAPPSVWDGTVAAQKLLSTAGPAGTAGRAFVRRRAADRHPAREEDAAGAFLRARLPACVRHRQRTERGRVAGRGAAAAGLRAARGQGRSRDAGADRPERGGAARGAGGHVPAGCSAARARARGAGRAGAEGRRRAGCGSGPARGKSAGPAAELSPEAEAVFERLRAWRAAVAKEQGMPAYVIFHDATLRQIAASPPSTLSGLGLHQRRGRDQAGQVRPAGSERGPRRTPRT